MNLRIPLPRIPARLTRMLDHYSDFNAKPTGPTLQLGHWRYRVLWRDWVSIAGTIAISATYALLWGGPWAFLLSVLCCILMWTLIEWM